MKKLLSILLIASTLFLSLGVQASFAKNHTESTKSNISQSVKTKAKVILHDISSFISSALFYTLIYCISYGSIKTLCNWSNEIPASTQIPLAFSSSDTFIHKFFKNLRMYLNPNAENSIPVAIGFPKETIKNPIEKWLFFTIFDAPCFVFRTANRIYNFFKYDIH